MTGDCKTDVTATVRLSSCGSRRSSRMLLLAHSQSYAHPNRSFTCREKLIRAAMWRNPDRALPAPANVKLKHKLRGAQCAGACGQMMATTRWVMQCAQRACGPCRNVNYAVACGTNISWLYLALIFLVDRFRTSLYSFLVSQPMLSCNIDFIILSTVHSTIS